MLKVKYSHYFWV